MIAIVPASPAHIGRIATRLRAIDAIECAAFGHTPKSALRAAMSGSSLAWTAKVDGVPVAMFGASTVSTLEGIGCPWMLGVDGIESHARALVETSKRYVEMMQSMFLVLENVVHANNIVSIRWLRHLGFSVDDHRHFVGEEPFLRFRRLRGSILSYPLSY